MMGMICGVCGEPNCVASHDFARATRPARDEQAVVESAVREAIEEGLDGWMGITDIPEVTDRIVANLTALRAKPADEGLLGKPVAKRGGDYEFDGEIVGVIRKRSGEVRYVVEDERGLLLIMNAKQVGIDAALEQSK